MEKGSRNPFGKLYNAVCFSWKLGGSLIWPVCEFPDTVTTNLFLLCLNFLNLEYVFSPNLYHWDSQTEEGTVEMKFLSALFEL